MTAEQSPRIQDFRVAIVGGGICGLVCAIGLMRGGVKVDLFEAFAKYGEVGAGVLLGPNAVRVLGFLDVLDEAVASGKTGLPVLRPINHYLGDDLIYTYPTGPTDVRLGVHRASLVDVLAKFVNGSQLVVSHFNKRCISVSPSPADSASSIIHFSDGTTHETDVVLGADGMKSAVRRFVIGEEASAKYPAFTNTFCYRGLVDSKALSQAGIKTPLMQTAAWMGDDKHLLTFPIQDGKYINIVANVTDFDSPVGAAQIQDVEKWVARVPKEELLAHFVGWDDDLQSILKHIEEPNRWAIHGLYPQLDTFVKDRVALLGDAAHAMLPHLSAGGGQGLEDAYVVSQLLASPQTNRSNMKAVLQAYDRIRVPRATGISRRSKLAGDIYDGHGPSGPSPEGRRADIMALNLEDIWRHDARADVEACLVMLA